MANYCALAGQLTLDRTPAPSHQKSELLEDEQVQPFELRLDRHRQALSRLRDTSKSRFVDFRTEPSLADGWRECVPETFEVPLGPLLSRLLVRLQKYQRM